MRRASRADLLCSFFPQRRAPLCGIGGQSRQAGSISSPHRLSASSASTPAYSRTRDHFHASDDPCQPDRRAVGWRRLGGRRRQEGRVSEEWFGKAAVLGFGIFSRPPKRLWTRNQAGALHTEAVRCTLPVGREIKTEIPVQPSIARAGAESGQTQLFTRRV